MPVYEYDKDYPFAAFITNLGKYNEGALVGEWVKFPTTHEELQKVFERIGIGAKDDFGNPYEEWFITDYDCYVGNLYDKLGEYENPDELNYLASKLDDMRRDVYNHFLAAMEVSDHTGSIQELINLTENMDCYDVYPDIEDHDDLGRFYIEEMGAMEVPEYLQNYIDYEAYGRDVALEEGGDFTEFGYVRDTGDRFVEVYDGNRENIPEEYRIMIGSDDGELSQEDKLDMATDLAFDLDEFFRQHDPQYAAEFPGEQEQKETLCNAMLDGKFASIEERLQAVAHAAPEDFHSRMEELKDAVGYEEFLDIDTEALREAIQNPDTSRADEMLAFAEQAEREYVAELSGQMAAEPPKMTVLVVEPMKEPYVKQIASGLRALQAEVNGDIAASYPFADPVALVVNDEGKLIGLDLNRSLRDDHGEIYDIVAGTFLVVGLGEEDFTSLSPDMIQKYTEHFKHPELFASINGQIVSVPVEQNNPLRTAEMTLEDDYGMIDGVINNGRRGEEQEKVAENTEKKSSIMDRLADAKKECADRKPSEKAENHKKPPELGDL